ncbi:MULTISPECIES: hypothetical protein [unclassified Streptomyces]|uniref:hypothetical protein n=1 Tax=unclassified Streptomyces TaxID=2593676 RepID=UPI002E808568|nr:hypothetical protein [Streptomyces sp. NBC_00589]WTI37650.1 hypothetical protein OIC96_22865 [Streptomyces sp. NBC_00775]WUB28672.1 hypothetical protein OHA51_26870 [Streptomyces sp. NBC_00589]
MRSALVWTVRVCGLVGWVAAGVACWWLLGVSAVPRPWTEPLVWGGVAAGCAVVRVGALWGLRVPRRRGDGEAVSLAKAGARAGRAGRTEELGRAPLDDVLGISFGSPGWVRFRTGAVWLLVAFVSGALFVGVMGDSSGNDRIDALREAGAEVSAATVVEPPRAVREDLSDDVVRGYMSRLVVSVSGGPERLTVKGAYTDAKPRVGTEVEVLWSRSAPRLGGVVHERESLRTLAAGRWEAFPDGANGGDALVAFVLIMIVGCVLGAVFTFAAGLDGLRRTAWSPTVQTVRGAMTVAVFLGWRPLLLGRDASAPEVPFVLVGLGGFVLVLLVYVFSSLTSFGED